MILSHLQRFARQDSYQRSQPSAQASDAPLLPSANISVMNSEERRVAVRCSFKTSAGTVRIQPDDHLPPAVQRRLAGSGSSPQLFLSQVFH